MNMNQKGFANIIVALIMLVVVVLGIAGYLILKSNQQPSPTPGIKTTGGAGGKDGSLQFPNGSITLFSPNGGETYTAGNQITVKWQTKNVAPTAGIWIHLDTADGRHLNNGDLVSSWTDAPNNGEKTVTIPVDIPAGQYKLAVTVGQELEDVSDNYFTITSATPTITQEQARILVLQTWGGCTPDTCESVTVTAHSNYVTAIYEGIRSDSVSAQKKVASAHYSNNVWTLGELIESSQRCQPERGHQNFSPDPCI
jgi:hypothetical protein